MSTTSQPRIEVSRSHVEWSSMLDALADAYQEVVDVADAYHDRWYGDLADQLNAFRAVVRATLAHAGRAANSRATIALTRDVWLDYVEAFRDGVEELGARPDAVQVRAREAWVALVASLPAPAGVAVQSSTRRCLSCGRRLPITRFRQFASGAFSHTCADCHSHASGPS